jgi:GGDEF domain-containing protein
MLIANPIYDTVFKYLMENLDIAKEHHLKGYEYETEDELMKKILSRLEKAASDKELLAQMEMEEMAVREYECSLGILEKKLQQKEIIIEEKDKTIEESTKTIEENKKTIEEKDKSIEEKDKLIKELLKRLENTQ